VRVSRIVADSGEGRKVYSPGHPDADADGFVTFPDVNPVHEVVNLLSAARSYDADATALETLKQMAARGLDITR
jgi:flagellar basal-body rod protein FlgC